MVARSTILATEILQARRDAVMATFKILLDISNQELRNVPINSKLYFITKFRSCQGQKQFRSSNKGPWQIPLLLITYNNKVNYLAPPVFKKLKQQLNLLGITKRNCTCLSQTQSYLSSRGIMLREVEIEQFPSSKQASSLTNS